VNGHIDDSIRAAIKRLRDIRNRVVYATEFQPSTDDADQFVLLAAGVAFDLNQLKPP
jgi:hypothetical protein